MTRRMKVKAVHRAQRQNRRQRRYLESGGLTSQARTMILGSGKFFNGSIGAMAARTVSQKKG